MLEAELNWTAKTVLGTSKCQWETFFEHTRLNNMQFAYQGVPNLTLPKCFTVDKGKVFLARFGEAGFFKLHL